MSRSIKQLVRLSQLLLFSAGHGVKNNLVKDTGIESLIINRYGNHAIYQSEWSYYLAMLKLAQNTPNKIIKTTTTELIKISGNKNNSSTRDTVAGLFYSLMSTFLEVRDELTNIDLANGPLLTHFSLTKDGHIYFAVSEELLNFWMSGEWEDDEQLTRATIGSNELALWVHALSFVVLGKVTPPATTLIEMSRVVIKRQTNFIQHIKRAIDIINESSTIECELGKNSKQEYVIAFHR